MVGIRVELHEAVRMEHVNCPLYSLPRHTETTGSAGHSPVALAQHAQKLPARLRLTGQRRDPVTMPSHRTGRLEQIRDQEAHLIGRVLIWAHSLTIAWQDDKMLA